MGSQPFGRRAPWGITTKLGYAFIYTYTYRYIILLTFNHHCVLFIHHRQQLRGLHRWLGREERGCGQRCGGAAAGADVGAWAPRKVGRENTDGNGSCAIYWKTICYTWLYMIYILYNLKNAILCIYNVQSQDGHASFYYHPSSFIGSLSKL